MDDKNERHGSASTLYLIALAIAAGGGALGYAWGLAQLLVRS